MNHQLYEGEDNVSDARMVQLSGMVKNLVTNQIHQSNDRVYLVGR